MGDAKKHKILKEELKHQAKDGGFELQKAEAKRKMRKLDEDSNKISLGSINEEDIDKIVNNQKMALYSSLAGIEITEDVGDLKEKVLSSIDRMEERMREKIEEKKIREEREEEAKKEEELRQKKKSKLRKKIKEKLANFKKKVKKAFRKTKQWVKDKYSKIFAKKGKKAVAKKIEEKLVSKTGAKTLQKQGSKVATKASSKVLAKTGTKVVAKASSKAVFKSVVKKIPVVSAVAGVAFGVERCLKGEWKEAGGEVLSGVLGCFPGVGTVASVAVDAGLLYNDISKVNNEQTAISGGDDKNNPKELSKIIKKVEERGENLRMANVNKTLKNDNLEVKKVAKISANNIARYRELE